MSLVIHSADESPASLFLCRYSRTFNSELIEVRHLKLMALLEHVEESLVQVVHRAQAADVKPSFDVIVEGI